MTSAGSRSVEQAFGTVREWRHDVGQGVIDSAKTPGGCWVHFSALSSPSLQRLIPGMRVGFVFEDETNPHGYKHGFGYRATQVWSRDEETTGA